MDTDANDHLDKIKKEMEAVKEEFHKFTVFQDELVHKIDVILREVEPKLIAFFLLELGTLTILRSCSKRSIALSHINNCVNRSISVYEKLIQDSEVSES